MSDLIDRAEAQTEIQLAARRYTVAHEAHGEGRVVWSDSLISVADAMNALRKVPSAQPDAPDTNVGTTIYRQAAIDALDVLCQEHRYKIPGKRETYSQYNEAWQDALDRAEGAIFNLPSAQPKIIRCKDCDWWTKQEDSLQGRCDRYGMYPTGYWYCASARERREE